MSAVLDKTETTTTNGASRRATFTFNAVDVTGTRTLEARDFQRTIPAGLAARTLASQMALPENVPWALRDDATGSYLNPDEEIGKQISPGSTVSITPKTHLG